MEHHISYRDFDAAAIEYFRTQYGQEIVDLITGSTISWFGRIVALITICLPEEKVSPERLAELLRVDIEDINKAIREIHNQADIDRALM